MRVRVLGFRSDPNPTLTLILTLTVVKDPRTIDEADFAEAQSVSFFEARLFLKGTYEAPVQLTPTPTLTPTLALTPTLTLTPTLSLTRRPTRVLRASLRQTRRSPSPG